MEFGACPRCQGDMHISDDVYGEYRECLQCGFMVDTQARLAGDNPSFDNAKEYREYSRQATFNKQVKQQGNRPVLGTAQWSVDYSYRYYLDRRLGHESKIALFIGANPSKADEYQNDLTVTKGMKFAQSWGCGRFIMTNLSAFVATQPNAVPQGRRGIEHPSEPGKNWEVVFRYSEKADIVVACWGDLGLRDGLGWQMLNELDKRGIQIWCLGVTSRSMPVHLSRIAYARQLQRIYRDHAGEWRIWIPQGEIPPGRSKFTVPQKQGQVRLL